MASSSNTVVVVPRSRSPSPAPSAANAIVPYKPRTNIGSGMGYNHPMRSNQGEIAALLRKLVNSDREKRERRRCEEDKKQKEEQMLKAKEEEEKRREENERKEADRDVRMVKLFDEQFAAMERKKDDAVVGKRHPANGKEIASRGVRSSEDKPKARDGSLKIGDNEAKKRGQEALQGGSPLQPDAGRQKVQPEAIMGPLDARLRLLNFNTLKREQESPSPAPSAANANVPYQPRMNIRSAMGYNNPMRSNQGEIAAVLRKLVNSDREKRESGRCEEDKKQKEEQMLKAKEEEEKRREENERKKVDRKVRMGKLFAEQFAAMERKKKDDEAVGKRDPAKGKEIASGGVRSSEDKPKARDGSLKIGDNEAKKRGQEALQAYFLEWRNGVRTKRGFAINPSQVIDIGEWEAAYNQHSLDPVQIRDIIDAMTMAYSQAKKTYQLPTLKLAPLGLVKSTPGVRADRLRPEDWKDELVGQYYYYAVAGQHNVAAARALLGTDVAVRYNFERWAAQMVYFSDEDFEGYFLVSAEDNKKYLKAPPRQLKLSIRDIRWCWKELGYPKAVMGNPNGKQAQVEAWRRFCAEALHRMPYNHFWTLADDKTEKGIKKQNAALRSYFPLAMAGKSAWETGMEFFERWETARLLAPEGAKWIAKKKKVQGLKPGVSHIENEKDGRKVVVYNVPVEGPQKKGKKEKEPGDWFVQVTEPDPHCWKSMEALNDNEKCRLLKKVLNCEVVWVQTGSSALAKQKKLGMQEAVQLVKCDRILVRLWNYYQFKHENRPDSDWTTKYPFLKKQEAILAKFEGQGLDAALWDGSRKLVSDSSLFKDCLPYMGCEDDKSIKATEKLVQNKKLPIDWKNKVLSVLTGSRSKSMEVALSEGMVHILWNDSKDVTTIAPFGVDPLDAQMKVVELERAVGIMKCHTCVLELCEPVDIKQWTAKVFKSLNALVEHLFPSHWTVVAFVPREHDYYFMTSQHHLSVVKAMAGKWVRRTQQKKSFGVGHNLYSLDDRMYILFKGDDLRENTYVVYDARLAADDAAAVGALQKVTPTEISDMPFNACEWPVVIHGHDPVVYKGHERNPTQFAHLLEFLCEKGDDIMFLGKAHAQVVWEVLKGGRNVIALEGNSEWLQFTLDFLKTAVNSGAYHCEFITKSEKPRRVWDPSTDMWFKLSARKRSRIYEFLFFEKSPARGTDIDYMRRKEHMLALLDNYHGAMRLNAKNFLDRLELLYFVESEPASEMGAALAVREATSPALRQGRSAESQREIAGAAPSAFLATKSAGIRTSSVTCLQSEEAGTTEGATSVHTDDRSLGSALMRLQGAESRETDGGEEWVEVEGGEEGEDGEEGGLSITDEESVDAGDEDVCGETSNSFGLVYAIPGEGDIDDDATAMEMETQVVSGLSVDHKEYDALHLATAVHPPDGCDEAIMTVSPAKTTRRLSVNEVIDSILGDVQAKTLPSTPSKDDALLSNETFAVGDLALIQPCFPVPWSPLAGGRGGVVKGRQHITSPKKCRGGTPALAVLALPAPTSPTKERKEKQAGKH
ncbi:hypothetical protein CBR_g40094 [Chara braunii]|uniref:Uncharacterized protein n=1 Tax=Chara braunii TaxID=69332 RepID=A0A388LTB7_CHABU|nr:hypothetical protein CBR_g40094 [Chara braunii]|eukprot:GBG85452.1 hypothetical protein CBR_g40094 [Chara braunii]